MASASLSNLELDSLCCQEDNFFCSTNEEETPPRHETDMFMFWDEKELLWLSSKEKELPKLSFLKLHTTPDTFSFWVRKEGVEWLVRASSRLGFCSQTTILAVDYFDRFMWEECGRVRSQPWLTQLSAVACLSLAAKVEETHVPLLLDLQVEEARFVFEAKTIQRMELLVLSTLGWRMNPVTPLSFVDHIARRMASENENHWEFQSKCQSILLSLVTDSRWLEFMPSVLASATMLHVIGEFDQIHKVLIFSLPNATKEKIDVCYQFIHEVNMCGFNVGGCNGSLKRKNPCYIPPSSPDGVIGSAFSFDSSSNSWNPSLLKKPNTGSITTELSHVFV